MCGKCCVEPENIELFISFDKTTNTYKYSVTTESKNADGEVLFKSTAKSEVEDKDKLKEIIFNFLKEIE